MPFFLFYRLHDGHRIKLAERNLASGEAARDFGIDLAEQTLRAEAPDDQPASSRIVICDSFGGDLDTIISERF